jgi:hypothetical protein
MLSSSLITLMMEVVHFSETSVISTRVRGATYQKTAILYSLSWELHVSPNESHMVHSQGFLGVGNLGTVCVWDRPFLGVLHSLVRVKDTLWVHPCLSVFCLFVALLHDWGGNFCTTVGTYCCYCGIIIIIIIPLPCLCLVGHPFASAISGLGCCI